jgi:hypothetical protein
VAAGIALAFNNPTIGHTDDGEYQCFAPYDTILFAHRNNVGEHADDGDIERRCYAANRNRFALACVFVGLGALVGGIAATSAARRRRRI